MSEEFNLTWGEDRSIGNSQIEPSGAIAAAGQKPQEDQYALAALPPNEQQAVLALRDKIDVSDSNAIISFGSESQNKIAAFSDSVLKTVKTKDSGEAGKLLTDLVVNIKTMDGDEKQGFLGIFSGAKKQYQKMIAQYSKVETNIEKIEEGLENHKRVLLKDIAILDDMYKNNQQHFKELTLYIIAGKEKLTQLNNEVLPRLKAEAQAEGADEMLVQKYNDTQNAVNRFEKKIHDLILTRTISLQMAPQIRLLQNSDALLVDKISSSVVNAIPLWKNQIVIALGLQNQKSALESQKRVTEMTNSLLQKNSEILKAGSLEIAKESEEGIISIETIRKTNQNLVDTINGIIDIQQKGREQRIAAEQELVKLESEFKTALIAAKGR